MKQLLQSFSRPASVLALVVLSSRQKSLEETQPSSAILSVATVGNNLSVAASNLVADWETGNANQWYSIGQAHPGRYSTVTWPVRQGKYSGKFVVHPGDYYYGERCEVNMWVSRTSPVNNYTQEVPGNDFYYGWSTYFPTDWKTPPGYCIFSQFQQRADNLNPAISFNVLKETIQVNFNTGTVTGNATTRATSFQYMPTHNTLASPIILGSLNRGKWHDFIVHVRFAPDNSGVFEVWHRLEGTAEFAKVLAYPHVATEAWITDRYTFLKEGVFTNYRLNNVNGYVPNIYVKMGLYRPAVSGNTITNTIYHDNWSRSTSYAAVRAKFK